MALHKILVTNLISVILIGDFTHTRRYAVPTIPELMNLIVAKVSERTYSGETCAHISEELLHPYLIV